MTISENEMYIASINEFEQHVVDDNLYPKVRSSRCKAFCYIIAELAKECIRYFKFSSNNNATKETKGEGETQGKIH